jgi:hypothetical protein
MGSPSQGLDYMLAAIIWHEMAHVEGADEQDAQKREQELWTSFIRDERVDRLVGLRYLEARQKRRDRDDVLLVVSASAGSQDPY